MQGIMVKILYGIGARLLTESLLGKLLVYSLWKAIQSTENTLDDKIVTAVADALGVKDYK